MDIGSFIFEADGVRWAIDLGAQDYESLESRGVDLWNTRQDSQRWDVFRLGNLSHNTLVMSGRHQRVAGSAKFIDFSDDRRNPFDVVDMSDVYQGQAGSIIRGLAMPNRSKLVVYDKLDRLADDSRVRWGFVTEADVDIQSPRHAYCCRTASGWPSTCCGRQTPSWSCTTQPRRSSRSTPPTRARACSASP